MRILSNELLLVRQRKRGKYKISRRRPLMTARVKAGKCPSLEPHSLQGSSQKKIKEGGAFEIKGYLWFF